MGKIIKVIDLLKILLTQDGDIPEYISFENYKYKYDSKENDYFCEQLNYFLFMNVLGDNLEINLDLPITMIEENPDIKCSEYTIGDSFKVNGFTFARCDGGLCGGGLMVIPPEQEKVIEDKEIEKLNVKYTSQIGKIALANKIDEVIDVVNGLKKGK